MTIYQAGQINPLAMYAPGVYTQIAQPSTSYIQGVQTNALGYVGVASWGPVNSPVLSGSTGDAQNNLGPQTVRKRDLATALAIANMLGANNVQSVRITDGTDVAATALLKDTAAATGATLTAFYTGIVGNTLTAALTAGSKASTTKLTISRPGFTPEVYDNIVGTGAALWAALVSAVNNGISNQRGPSQLAVATIGASAVAPNLTATVTFAGGTDGDASVTDAMQIGADGTSTTRTGMYALRGSGVMTAALVDHTDPTAWNTIQPFAMQEGIFFGEAGSVGQSYTAVSTALNTAGADTYGLKVLVGDWVYWNDTINGQMRLLSPATFWAAMRATLNPNESTLNKNVSGVAGTQRTLAKVPYSNPELAAIAQARLDFLGNPSAGGNYFGFQTDRNASSSTATNSEAYTTMTNFLALSFQNAMGDAIGKPQTDELRTDTRAKMNAFLTDNWDAGFIGDPNNPSKPPFLVTLDSTNNPPSQVALGVMQAYAKVKYLSIVREFLITLEGGQSVSVTVQ
jgi:hypothetical protein